MAGKVRIGCSGWSYPTWRPAFYPEKTPLKKLLPAYAARLNAVEVNYTFRTLPKAATVARWLAETPETFRFAPKAPQRVTHMLRLRGAQGAMESFAASLAPLKNADRLGPVLLQLPPHFRAEPELLRAFLDEIAGLPLRTTWEFRDPSWFTDEVYGVLKEAGSSLCAAESDTLRTPDLPLHPGLRVFRLRRSVYTAGELDTLAGHFVELAEGGADVYAFLKHEEAPDGPLRALELTRRVPTALLG